MKSKMLLSSVVLFIVLSQHVIAASGTDILLSDSYSRAFKRATVLGRANGAARECGVSANEVSSWQEAVDATLSKMAQSPSDLNDSMTRYGLETMKARRGIREGAVDCATGHSFWKEQYKGIKRSVKK